MLNSPQKRRRVFVYVDGFNLYHRKLECNSALKWLCLRTLFSRHIFPNDDVLVLKYFSAKVDPYAKSPTERQLRQAVYWSALANTGVETILGRLERRFHRCNASCKEEYPKMAEKMSDVNLALHLYRDAVREKPDIICVLSADLDTIPPLLMVRQEHKCAITILLPTDDPKVYWSRQKDCSFARLIQLQDEWIARSQLPSVIDLASGEKIHRPIAWR